MLFQHPLAHLWAQNIFPFPIFIIQRYIEIDWRQVQADIQVLYRVTLMSKKSCNIAHWYDDSTL